MDGGQLWPSVVRHVATVGFSSLRRLSGRCDCVCTVNRLVRCELPVSVHSADTITPTTEPPQTREPDCSYS